MEFEAKIDYKNLKKLATAMAKKIKVKIGLLANKGGSNTVSDNLDLAGLGAIQEFGCQIPVTDKMRGFLSYKFGIHLKKDTKYIVIPSRSFLQMPLERQNELKNRMLKNMGVSAKEFIYIINKTGDLFGMGVLLGAAAVEQIQEAFDTGGWGEWEPNSEITSKGKGSKMPLVDTGSLRQHITFEVEYE